MNRERGGNSILRSSMLAGVLFSIPLFFANFRLSGPMILLLIALAALVGAVLEVMSSNAPLGVGGALVLGFVTAISGALFQALATIYLLLSGGNPVGRKIAVVWEWLLRGPLQGVAPNLEVSLRSDLAWLLVQDLDARALIFLALFSAAVALVPAVSGALLGSLVMGGAHQEDSSSP